MTIRISEKRAQCLKQLNINTANDILMNFPTRYENIEFLPFEQWKQNSDIIVSATVIHMPKISFFKGNKCVVYFDASIDNLNFSISAFNQKWLLKLKPSQKITIIGKYQGSNKILATKINYQDINQQLGIKPVYQLKNLINDKWYRQLVDDILKDNVEKVENYLPQSLIDKYGLLDRKEAIKQLHQPESLNKLTEAIKTMKYEEFFLFNLLMAYRKKLNKIENCNFSKNIDFNYLKKYRKTYLLSFISRNWAVFCIFIRFLLQHVCCLLSLFLLTRDNLMRLRAHQFQLSGRSYAVHGMSLVCRRQDIREVFARHTPNRPHGLCVHRRHRTYHSLCYSSRRNSLAVVCFCIRSRK